VSTAAPLSSYQRRLFTFLSVATFFEGYDFIALTQVLPQLRAAFRLDHEQAGWLVGFINLGTIVACFLVRKADAWGRRRVLTVTIAGYTLSTLLTAFSPNVYAFAAFQMTGRVFLLGEYAISMVIAAEEMPAARRGMVIGVIASMGVLGSILCAGLVPVLVKATPLGWRAVYLVGVLPLVILAYARRSLRETERFARDVGSAQQRSLLEIWRTPYRRRVLELGAIWFLTYLCTQNAVTFWKDFAMHERGLSEGQVGLSITIAAVVSLPLVFLVGKLLDWIGRRPTAAIVFVVTSLGVFSSYSLHGWWPLTAALTGGIFGTGAVLPVLNSYNAELFPTAHRGDAFAWSNNILGRIGYVLSPAAVGLAAKTAGWGPAVSVTAIFPLFALGLILWWLPETRAKELEETAAV
jgi:MFS transporter, putative metabolite:H+ symporter